MEKRSLNRRDFLRLSAAAAAGVIVAGCGPAPTPQVVEKVVKETVVVEGTPQVVEKVVKETVVVQATPPPAAVAEITYLDIDETGAGDAAFKVYTDQVIAPFNDQNSTIKVNFQAGQGQWSDALVASIAAGNAPDIFVTYIGVARKIMEAGQMLPLQEHFTEEELQDFLEEQLLAMRIGPSLFAVPKYASCVALAYNKDLLDKAGIPYPDDTWDWAKFLDALSKTAKLGTSELGKLFGYSVNREFMHHWVWQNGGEWMNKPMLGTKILIDEPKALEALKVQNDMIFKDHWAPTTPEIEGLGWWNTFQTGRFAFDEVHSWTTSELITNNKFKWDLVMLPKGPVKRAGMVFNDAYSVWAKTKYPDAAVKFLSYLTSADMEKTMMLSIHGWLPSRKSVFKAWETESLGAKNGFNVAAFTKNLQYSRQQPYFLTDDKVREIFDPLWTKIWDTGDLAIEEGVKQIAAKVNEYLATVA
jgi:multiple sugar transport system substrate-binding protein